MYNTARKFYCFYLVACFFRITAERIESAHLNSWYFLDIYEGLNFQNNVINTKITYDQIRTSSIQYAHYYRTNTSMEK